MTQRILVTGARGYLGGRLVKHLVSHGEDVVGSTRWTPKKPIGWPDSVPLLSLNLAADPNSSKTALEGIDCVYHLSAGNAAHSSKYPDLALVETAVGTRRLIEAAILTGVKRFVFLSPIQVYGNPLSGEITEATLPKPTNPYAISHLAGEYFALAASDRIEVAVVRLANGTGMPAWLEGDHWMLAGNDFALQAVEKGEIIVNAPGLWRDFIALEDVCRALYILAEKGNGVLNLGSGKARRISDLASLTASVASYLLGKDILVRELGAVVKNYVSPFHISTERFRALGFTPSTDELLEWEQSSTICSLLARETES